MSRNLTLEEVTRAKFDEAMKSYPIFREEYRQTLNDNIYDHYKYEPISIGEVTVWLNGLKNEMNLIMPKYNHLYESLDLLKQFNPLSTHEFWRQFVHAGTQSSESTGDVNSTRDTTGNKHDEGTSGSTSTTNDQRDTTTHSDTNGKTTNSGTSSSNTTETHNEDTTSNQTVKGKTTDTTTRQISDTPQGNLYRDDHNPDETTLKYLSSWERDTSNGTSDTTTDATGNTNGTSTTTQEGSTSDNGTSNTTEDGTENSKGLSQTTTEGSTSNDGTSSSKETYQEGRTGSSSGKDAAQDDTHEWGTNGTTYEQLVQQFRDLAIDIDNQIVEELQYLFQTVFNVTELLGSSEGYFAFPPYFYGRWFPGVFN